MGRIRPHFGERRLQDVVVMSLCLGANLAVALLCAAYLAAHSSVSGISWPWVLGFLFAGYLMADLVSGFVHWGIDTWFDWPKLGRVVAIAREHHTHPHFILGYGFLENAALGCGPTAVAIGLAAAITAAFPISLMSYGLMIVWFVTSSCLVFGTTVHNLSHQRSKSPIVRFAQKTRIIIRPEHHWVHHRGDQTVRYCVFSGWMNYVCDPLDMWRRLEWLIHKLTGAVPRQDDQAWQRHYRETGVLAPPPALD